MDVFAHSLWAAFGAKRINQKTGRKLSLGWSAFWGVFPDMLAFVLPMTLALPLLLSNGMSWSDVLAHRHDMDFAQSNGNLSTLAFWITNLYNVGHSLVTFGVVFGLVWLIGKKPRLEMLGWALHVLLDMPTHSSAFFPTPFLWPLFDIRINGIPWSHAEIMIPNYTLLLITFLFLFRKKAKLAADAPLGSGNNHRRRN